MAIDLGNHLVQAMRRVASPVTIITYKGLDGPRGVTIGSFTSLSLTPPLVSFNLMKGSSTHDLLVKASHFNIHILSQTQSHLCGRFATPDLDSEAQYEGVGFELDSQGVPVLDGGLAVIKCRPHQIVPAGDHSLVIAEVVEVVEQQETGAPLLYYQQSYRTVGGEINEGSNSSS